MRFSRCSLLILAFALAPTAYADDEESAPSLPDAEEEEGVEVVEETHTQVEQVRTTEERVEEVEDKLARMDEEIRQARALEIQEQSPITFNGYIDFGFFVPTGDGSGLIEDYGQQLMPGLRGQYGWVFLGDILATPVNTRGEAADLGEFPGPNRFDSVDSHGAPGFLLNEVSLGINVGFSESARVTTSVNFVPRTGREFNLGDFFDLDVAQLEWTILQDVAPTSIFAGKIEPVIGIEYKDRKSSTRFGITPSLVHRYTAGTQLGLKARSKLFDEWLIVAAAVTNGSAMTEQFHFFEESDSNSGKTGSGRVAMRLPLERFAPGFFNGGLELGLSGQLGVQDRASASNQYLWLAGVDLEYIGTQFFVRGQLLTGKSPGAAEDGVFSLDLKAGGYLEVDCMVTEMFGFLVRGEVRDAFVALGTERAYVTKSWRATVGARASINQHMTAKVEYLRNGEFGDVPEFLNDVFTTSVVFSY